MRHLHAKFAHLIFSVSGVDTVTPSAIEMPFELQVPGRGLRFGSQVAHPGILAAVAAAVHLLAQARGYFEPLACRAVLSLAWSTWISDLRRSFERSAIFFSASVD